VGTKLIHVDRQTNGRTDITKLIDFFATEAVRPKSLLNKSLTVFVKFLHVSVSSSLSQGGFSLIKECKLLKPFSCKLI
jgi:hypothetical protein